MTDPVYDMICSIGELIDKLSIENIKCSWANMRILEERRKARPDVAFISDQEFIARSAGEQRVRLKDELNKRLNEAIRRGGVQASPEARTYDMRDV